MTRRKRLTAAGLAVAAFVLLSAESCDPPADDRQTGNGKAADSYADTTNVTVWRNADQIPNVALFCADGMRFASTLSSDGVKQPQLLRIPEQDKQCQR